MSCTRELRPWNLDLLINSTDEMLVWEDEWHPATGIPSVDFVADVRNVVLGTSAAIAIKPALQTADVRMDRSNAGAAISTGSVITANNQVHYRESVSTGSVAWIRRGLSYKLTAGTFARAQVNLNTAFRACGKGFAPVTVEFNPTNGTDDVSYFRVVGQFATVGVDKVKFVIVGLDNANAKMDFRIAARGFNDPQARGGWTNLGSWTTPSAGDFTFNSGEVPFTGLTLSSYQWLELALAVRKQTGADPNSRCTFNVLPFLVFA